MAAAKQEMADDLEADAELLGVKRRKAAAAAAGAGGGGGGDAAGGGGGDAAAGEAAEGEEMVRGQGAENCRKADRRASQHDRDGTNSYHSSFPTQTMNPYNTKTTARSNKTTTQYKTMQINKKQVPVAVDAALLAELLDMGFPEARAARALHATAGANDGAGAGVEGAVAWLAEREGDASLDEPLLVPKVRERVCVFMLVAAQGGRVALGWFV